MKKVIFILILFNATKSYGALFGVSAEYVKNKITDITTEVGVVKDNNLKMQNEMGVMKENQIKLEMKIGQINNEISAKVTGLDKSINTEIKAGRDANNNSSNTNDTKLMMYIIKGLIGLCTTLICIVFWTVKAMFREMGNARYYQTSVAKLSKNGEFDEIMRFKKEIDRQKSITNKIIRAKELFTKGGNNVNQQFDREIKRDSRDN